MDKTTDDFAQGTDLARNIEGQIVPSTDLFMPRGPTAMPQKTPEHLSTATQFAQIMPQKPADLNLLIDETKLSQIIRTNPWEINVKATLESLSRRLYKNSEIKFRIGGRVLHSTSQVINAKSFSIIQDSQSTQEKIQEEEVSPDNFENFDETFEDGTNPDIPDMHELLGKVNTNDGRNQLDQLRDQAKKGYLQQRDNELRKIYSTEAFYHEDRQGTRFLASPKRKVYQKIDMADLGSALLKTFRYRLRSPSRNTFRLSPKAKVSDILPDNVLKKAEEQRAQVEQQIECLFEDIVAKCDRNEPVSFIALILEPSPEGIVRTLIYLLQLVNRKRVECWQELDSRSEAGEDFPEEFDDSGINIYASPIVHNQS